METFSKMERLIGNTPMVRLERTEKRLNLQAKLFAKLEGGNPTGSIKDRTAFAMLEAAKEQGLLKAGGTVIEPTSGNTGIALAALCAAQGYRAVIVMPETMSEERKRLMLAYGATLVLTEGRLGMQGAIDKANELNRQTPNSFIPDQFSNPANAEIHYKTTGAEIFEAMNGEVDFFVAGVGTGGTFTGASRYLKERIPTMKAVAIEPETSAVLSGGEKGAHGLQGIGAGFIPKVLDTSLIDEVATVSERSALDSVKFLVETEGLFVGVSSGAAFAAAVEIAKRSENKGKTIVTVFPDTGVKYLSVL